MGLYDRAYYREEPRGFGLGADVVPTLIAINVAIFFVDQLFTQGRLSDLLALRSNLPTHPWNFYTLATYGFAHATVAHVLFNMLALFFFGREIEGIYGRAEFLRLYLSTIVLSGLGWLVFTLITEPGSTIPVVGASGAISGICVLFALHYPHRTILIWGILPAPAWLLVSLYLVQDLFNAMQPSQGRGGQVAYAAHLAGAAAGFLYFKTGWSLGSLWPGGWLARMQSLGRLGRGPRLRVHRPSEGDGPGGPDEASLSSEVDRILTKITNEGEDKLTAGERQTLENASRRYQQRRR